METFNLILEAVVNYGIMVVIAVGFLMAAWNLYNSISSAISCSIKSFLITAINLLDKFIVEFFKNMEHIKSEQTIIKDDISQTKNNIDNILYIQNKQTDIITALAGDIKTNAELTNEIHRTNNKVIENNTAALNMNREALSLLTLRLDMNTKSNDNLTDKIIEHDSNANELKQTLYKVEGKLENTCWRFKDDK